MVELKITYDLLTSNSLEFSLLFSHPQQQN